MSEQHQPGIPHRPPALPPPDMAYRQGFLDGHLAGWKDALAAQDRATGTASRTSCRDVPTEPPMQPGTTPTPAAAKMPPNKMPQLPAFGSVPAGERVPSRLPQPPRHQPQLPPRVQQPAMAPAMTPPALQRPQRGAAPHNAADAAAGKHKRETHNINITLYAASLLMVAAAALFVGSNLPAAPRLVGVWAGTALFYAAGLLLHSRVARLRPAAVAFTGTALAIIPFAGVATYNLGFPEAPAVWLGTSLVGTVAYICAAVLLRSRLVVYLSLAFLLSTAWSSVAVLGAALAWYFTALIVFAALLSLAGHLLAPRGSSAGGGFPGLYAKPLSDLGPWFAPVGLAGSLAFGLVLNAADHALVLMAGVFYYAVMAVTCAPALRRYNYVGLRLCLSLAASFIGWMVHAELAWAAGTFAVTLAAQALCIAYLRKRIGAYLGSAGWIRIDVFSSIPVMAAASLMWSLGWYWSQADAGGNTQLAAVGVGAALLISMACVPAFLPRGEWLPLPAAGAVLLFAPFLEAAGWTALLALALIYTGLRYLTATRRVVRHGMLVGARILATALIASILAAVVPAHPGKAHLIVTVIAIMAALQLVADTLLAKYGAANPVTAYSAAAWAAAGAALVATLSAAYAVERFSGTPDNPLLGQWRLDFLLAAGAVGIAVAAHSLIGLPRGRGWSSAELLAPAYFLVAALVTGPVFSAGGASVAWAVAMGYLMGAGLLLREQTPTLHRWLYWWGARFASLALAVALFQLWAEADPRTEIAGNHVGLGLALLTALVPHVVILTGAVLRGRPVKGLQTDVLVTLSAVVAGASSVAWADAGLWTTMAGAGLVAAAVAGLAAAGTLRRDPVRAAVWAGPAALVAMALWTIPDRAVLVLVLSVIVVMSAVVATRAGGLLVRGAHFLLARVAVTALVGVAARELTDDLSAVSLALTLALLAQVALHYAAVSAGRITAAVGEPHLLQLSLWLLLAAQVVLPVAYHLAAGGFSAPGTALRGVVAVELLALAGTSVVAQALLLQRGASYLALVAVVGGAAVFSPVLWPGATALILLALTMAVIAWRCLYLPKTPDLRWYWLVATACFLITACLVDRGAPSGIFAGMWLVAGLALIVGAHLMKSRWLTLPGSLLVFLAAVLFRRQVFELTAHPGYAALAGFAVVVGALYVVRLLLLDLADARHVQRGSVVGTALGGGAFLALWSMADADAAGPAATAFTLVAVLACVEVPARLRRICVDVAVATCAAVWFRACSAHVDLGAFWAVQWCALALGALAAIRYVGKQPDAGKRLLVAAASFASLGAILTIFSGNSVQQVISLLVFAALLAVGMSLEERVFTVWGAIGVATAVIWYLRGFTYILLALLALALIGFVIWRLNHKKPHAGGLPPAQPGPAAGHHGVPALLGETLRPDGPPTPPQS